LNAAYGILVDSFHQALHPQRQTSQEEERESGVCGYRLCDRRVREKQTSRRLGSYRGCGVAITREKGHFAQRGSGFAGMDDHLTAPTDPDDAHLPFENECNAFRRRTRRPKQLASRKPSLDSMLQECVPSAWSQELEKLIFYVGLRQRVSSARGGGREDDE
jgi:hypothetical protein